MAVQDGVFLQRFTSVSSCKPQASLAPGERQQGGCYYYDNITAHCLDAAARHGRRGCTKTHHSKLDLMCFSHGF